MISLKRIVSVFFLLFAAQSYVVADEPVQHCVLQHQFQVASSQDADTLYTFGVGPCIAVTIWDPDTQIGVLAHIDHSTVLPRSLGMMMGYMRTAGADLDGDEKVSIVGGHVNTSEELIEDTEEYFEDRYDIEASVDGPHPAGTSTSACLDLSDGTVGQCPRGQQFKLSRAEEGYLQLLRLHLLLVGEEGSPLGVTIKPGRPTLPLLDRGLDRRLDRRLDEGGRRRERIQRPSSPQYELPSQYEPYDWDAGPSRE